MLITLNTESLEKHYNQSIVNFANSYNNFAGLYDTDEFIVDNIGWGVENDKTVVYGLHPRSIFNINFFNDKKGQDFLDVSKTEILKSVQFIEHITKKPITEFNYDKISEQTNDDIVAQLKIFLAREKILYEILLAIINITLQKINIVYNKKINIPDDIVLDDIQLGVFGSIKPTSDIDIGVSNYNLKNNHCLKYIIKLLEDLFIDFTGVSSLQFAIETYADYLILKKNQHSYFYLNTNDLDMDDFADILPYILSGIFRNYIANFESQKLRKLDEVDLTTIKEYKLLIEHISNDFKKILKDQEIINNAKALLREYISKPYNDQREKYYELVDIAENIMTEFKKNNIVDKLKRKQMIIAIAHSLLFREESYLLVPTIIHVVRIMQAKRNDANNAICAYPTIIPKCSLGDISYIISILEQIGYIIRFRLHYCEGHHKNDKKCIDKHKKYFDRLLNAFGNIKGEDIFTDKKYPSQIDVKRAKNKNIQRTKKHLRNNNPYNSYNSNNSRKRYKSN